MRISHKIALALGIVTFLVTSVLSYVALSSAQKLGQRLDSVYANSMPMIRQAHNANRELDDIYIALSSAIDHTGSRQPQDLEELAESEQKFAAIMGRGRKKLTTM